MVEFGARLSLKDNMYATLQKNLKMQRKFSEQVKQVSNNVKALGKAKAAPIIKAKDQASAVVKKIKDNLKAVGKAVAKPFITVKDGATKIINKVTSPLKKLGKMVAKPFIKIKDGASKVLSPIWNGLKKIGSTVAKAAVKIKDGATAALSKIGGMLKSLAKGVTIAVGIAGAGATALVGGSLSAGASMEQNIGGVETLFGADAGAVMANADKAYETAGLSANAYLETVTGFSASLLQSLSGDTKKAAAIADRALIDMADNANKMGTDMGSIQNAYQGFAKQNYTMLDNLKLGYGGTQEEMQRLIKEASAMKGAQEALGVSVDAGSMSFDNIINAISVVQKNMGIANATADEAKSTFTGSFNAMKASAQNFLSNLALGGDMTGSVEQVIDTASTFLFNNALPMIGRIFESLPDVIGVAIEKGVPKIKQLGGTIATALRDGLKAMLPAGMAEMIDPTIDSIREMISIVTPVAGEIGNMFAEVAPVVVDALGSAFGDGAGFVQGFADIVSGAIPVVRQVILSLAQVFKATIPAIAPILTTLGTMVQMIFPVITNIIAVFGNLVSQIFPIIASVISVALTAVMPIIQALANIIQIALPVVSTIISTVASVIASVMPTISRIFTEVGTKIAEIVTAVIVPIVQKVGDIFEKISPVIQSAVEVVAQILSSAWDIISPIIDLAMVLFDALWAVLDPIITSLVDAFVWLWDKLEPVFSWLSDALSAVGDFIGSIGDWIGGFFGGDDSSSHAYGLDRVPYDNYPAVLHQGEKVLTRNQADQYERSMSTRGVQLNNALQPVESVISRDATSGIGSAGQPQEVKEISKAGATVNIEKLADTVVIEKEADVDKVVEDMVKKFRKLVPNMA